MVLEKAHLLNNCFPYSLASNFSCPCVKVVSHCFFFSLKIFPWQLDRYCKKIKSKEWKGSQSCILKAVVSKIQKTAHMVVDLKTAHALIYILKWKVYHVLRAFKKKFFGCPVFSAQYHFCERYAADTCGQRKSICWQCCHPDWTERRVHSFFEQFFPDHLN